MQLFIPLILLISLAYCKPNGDHRRDPTKKTPWRPPKHHHRPEFRPKARKVYDHIVTDYADLKVDHFNPGDARTFKNRYFMNADFYKPGGPAFLYFPGEAPASDWFVQTYFANPGFNALQAGAHFFSVISNNLRNVYVCIVDGATSLSNVMRNAVKLNGIAFTLEHRYFGESMPVDNPETPEGIQYLTARQAIGDAAEFIKYCNQKYNLTASKWVAFGGSYSGSLVAFFRLKYPDVVAGAISNSGPFLATNNFKEYIGTVGYNLKEYSMDCFNQTWAAFAKLQELVETNPQELQRELELCKVPPPGNKKELASLMEVFTMPFTTTMQYGGDFRGQYGNQSISGLCKIVTNRTVPLVHRLRQLVQWSTPLPEGKCVESGYEEDNANLREMNDNRGWRYLCCNEFGWFMTTDSEDEPFADTTKAISQKYFYDQCFEVFGLTRAQIDANIKETNALYGGNRNMNATNVVIINGSQDPCHPAGAWKKEWEKPGQTIIYQKGAAHSAESYPPRDDDLPDVKMTRVVVDQKVAEWTKTG